jgi:hypothetical protein
MANKLDRQVSGKPAGILNQDGSGGIGAYIAKHVDESWPGRYPIGPRHGGVIELADDLETMRRGISPNGILLPREAVLFRANICSRASPVV